MGRYMSSGRAAAHYARRLKITNKIIHRALELYDPKRHDDFGYAWDDAVNELVKKGEITVDQARISRSTFEYEEAFKKVDCAMEKGSK